MSQEVKTVKLGAGADDLVYERVCKIRQQHKEDDNKLKQKRAAEDKKIEKQRSEEDTKLRSHQYDQEETLQKQLDDVWYEVRGKAPVFKVGSTVLMKYMFMNDAYRGNHEFEMKIESSNNGMLRLDVDDFDRDDMPWGEWASELTWTGVRQLYFSESATENVQKKLNLVEVIPISDLDVFRLPIENENSLKCKCKPERLDWLEPKLQSFKGIDVAKNDTFVLGGSEYKVSRVIDGGTYIQASTRIFSRFLADTDPVWGNVYCWIWQTPKGWRHDNMKPKPIKNVVKANF